MPLHPTTPSPHTRTRLSRFLPRCPTCPTCAHLIQSHPMQSHPIHHSLIDEITRVAESLKKSQTQTQAAMAAQATAIRELSEMQQVSIEYTHMVSSDYIVRRELSKGATHYAHLPEAQRMLDYSLHTAYLPGSRRCLCVSLAPYVCLPTPHNPSPSMAVDA